MRSSAFLWGGCRGYADVFCILSAMIFPTPDLIVPFALRRFLLEQFGPKEGGKVVSPTYSNDAAFAFRHDEVDGGIESRPRDFSWF